MLGCKGGASASTEAAATTATLADTASRTTATLADTASAGTTGTFTDTASAGTTGMLSTSADPAASAAPSGTAAASGPCPAGMIRISGGTFRRHKPNARRGPVTVAAFCIDRQEVTVAAYKACVKEKKCSPRCLEIGRCSAVPIDADWPDPIEATRASMFCNGSRTDRDDHPVNCVSYDEAAGFCAAREERLPTGDEWEWTALGDKPSPIFPWGPAAPEGEELCWGRPVRRPSTCLPGALAKDTSRDGVVDLAGNVSEWVNDGTPEKPLRHLRGASWYAVDDGYIQAALFGFDSTSSRSEVFGFRCAAAVTDSAPSK
ncbi:MAG: SUMF1/EgtB/PvdO family nonheme iron enzyme [Polyangiaceae bacterium]